MSGRMLEYPSFILLCVNFLLIGFDAGNTALNSIATVDEIATKKFVLISLLRSLTWRYCVLMRWSRKVKPD